MNITVTSFSRGSEEDHRRGLVGYVAVDLDELLQLDGVAVRRTRDGRRVLSFPERIARDGRRREIVRPLDADARRRIEAAVFGALQGELDLSR